MHINRKAVLSAAAIPLAGFLALGVTAPASAAPGYHDGTANITVAGETINACRYSSVSAIVDAINARTTTDVTSADVVSALGTSDLSAFQRENCRRSGDGRYDRRRGTTGTTVIDCTDPDNEGRVLDTRYRGAADRYNDFYRNRYERDRSLLNLSILRGLYDDYRADERRYRDHADRRRERVVVDCGDQNSSSAAPAPTTVNNYQVVGTPPGGSGSSSGGTTSYRTPRGGAETGDGSTNLAF